MKLKTHTQSPLAESAEVPNLKLKSSLPERMERKGVGRGNRHNWPSFLGIKFGGLTLASLEPAGMTTCLCVCGKKHFLRRASLMRGSTTSCGCLTRAYKQAARDRKGFVPTTRRPEYAVWAAMKQRCQNPKSQMHPLYGARGIEVCSSWQNSFKNFFSDMGERPSSKHSLDRVDNSKGYSPENCRWATAKQQSRNTRRTIYLSLGGVRKSASEWVEELRGPLGLTIPALRGRRVRKWTDTEILTTPNRKLLKA